MNSQNCRRRWFQQTALAGVAASLQPLGAVLAAKAKQRTYAYVGTFSSPLQDPLPTQVDLPPGNGLGIHAFEMIPETGELLPRHVQRMGTSPSHVVINEAGTRLYSTNETAVFPSERSSSSHQGTVSAFAIDQESGRLEHLNDVPSGGAGPTFASIHPSGRYLFVANYFGGSVSVLPITADGKLGEATDVQTDEGSIGPTRATNAPPGSFAISGHDRTHAHMIAPDKNGRHVLHVDLGLDAIFCWEFDSEHGKLIANDPASVRLPPGDGPRHFAFHPNSKWLYSIQEEGSTVVRFDYDAANGRLKPKQTISTLPRGYAGSNFCSGIKVSADGRFLYAGNRLHDSIAIFLIGEDGNLRYLKEVWTRGNYPRSFSFDPSGSFLYVCNQRSDNVCVFQVNQQTGNLKFTGDYIAVGNPSSVAFCQF